MCSWTDCEKSLWEIWKSVPKKEYTLWISSFSAPMAFLSLDPEASLCFSRFFALRPEQLKEDNDSFWKLGFEIKMFGDTNETQD
jgi:hypothetical protein